MQLFRFEFFDSNWTYRIGETLKVLSFKLSLCFLSQKLKHPADSIVIIFFSQLWDPKSPRSSSGGSNTTDQIWAPLRAPTPPMESLAEQFLDSLPKQ